MYTIECASEASQPMIQLQLKERRYNQPWITFSQSPLLLSLFE